MNFLLKMLEKLLLWHNEEAVLSKNNLHDNQYGFRKGRSCDSALTSLVGRIEHAFIKPNRGFALAVFLDIEGAYDNLRNGSIVRAMKRRGCSPHYVNWTLDFLKHRFVSVD